MADKPMLFPATQPDTDAEHLKLVNRTIDYFNDLLEAGYGGLFLGSVATAAAASFAAHVKSQIEPPVTEADLDTMAETFRNRAEDFLIERGLSTSPPHDG